MYQESANNRDIGACGIKGLKARGKLLFFLFMALPATLFAQAPLDDYIRLGLENNLALKQKEINFKRSLEALNEARSLFFPNISLNARYSVAEGGRTIDLPIGDLLNPVYSTLNQMLHQQIFPPVDNQSFMFLRPHEQETKIRMIQPLFDSDIYFNAKIKKELTETEKIGIDEYRQNLVAEIKKSYYKVTMTGGLVKMLAETRVLLEENVRVNKSLLENGKITADNLYRSETELSKFDQRIQVAEKDRVMARAYFNFLINRPLSEEVIITEPDLLPPPPGDPGSYIRSAFSNREEIKKLEKLDDISTLQLKMNQAAALPNLMIVADYGIQGEQYKVNKEADFAQASAVLTWDLFTGFRNRSKNRQAKLHKEMLDEQVEEVRKQIELQVMNAFLELKTSQEGIVSAESQVKSAREGFRLVKRRYEVGQATLIEFIDARTNLTQAEENLIIAYYARMSNYAEFEKVTAINKF